MSAVASASWAMAKCSAPPFAEPPSLEPWSTFAEAIMNCSAGTRSADVINEGGESAGGAPAADNARIRAGDDIMA